MISYEVYKLLHLAALFGLLFVAGGAAVHAANRGDRSTNAVRGTVAALHGVWLLLTLVGGFGMLARLGVKHDWMFPGWLWGKLIVWVLFAFAMVLPYRYPQLAKPLLIVAPFLAALAGFLAIFKPF